MNKDAVRVGQIDLPAVFPSVRLLESLRAAWSIPCLIVAFLFYAGFQLNTHENFENESPDLTSAVSTFGSATLAQWVFSIEVILVYGMTRGFAVLGLLVLRMLFLGFAAVGIARFTALLVNRHERSGVLQILRFMAGCWKPIVVSTFLTIAIVLLGVLCFRFAGYLPTWSSRGPNHADALNIVFWLYSLLTLVGLYVVLAGWLLGLSAIAIDGDDGAEALSRGISFVLSRFRRTSCFLILIGLLASVAGKITAVCLTESGRVALRSISKSPQIPPMVSEGVASFQTGLTECVHLSAFCCGLAIAYLILRQVIDNVDFREISDQKSPTIINDQQ
jgi:hypothetical protein